MLKNYIIYLQFALVVLFTHVVHAEVRPFLECTSVSHEGQATATVNVTKFWNWQEADPSSGFEVSYSYQGPNSLGDLEGAGSSASGTFTLTQEEANHAFQMDSHGNEIFQFSREESIVAFGFSFTAALSGGDAYVWHRDGKPLSYGLSLSCIKH